MSFGTWDCPAEHAARLARYRLQVRLDHLHFEDGSTLWVFRGTQQPTDIKSYRLTNCTRRAFDFAMKLVEDGAPFTIENPTGSWVWELPFAKKLYSHCFFVDFHACMFGSTRRKRTSLLTSHACFLALRKFCDNSHTHDAWELDQYGKFNTAKEAQYPAQFCQAYAKILDNTFSDQLVATTAGATEEMPDQNSNVCDPLHLRPFHQPRGRKIPQLVPEFLTVTTKVLASIPAVDNKMLTTKPLPDIPVKSKLLRTEAKQGGFMCVFGVFHSPEQFVTVSRSLRHPFDDLVHVPDILLKCIFDILTLGPVEISKRRIHTLLRWQKMSQELNLVEGSIHDNLPGHLKGIYAGKRFALLEKVATEMHWPDCSLHSELVQGFKLVGTGTVSHVFKQDVKPATISEEELMEQSKFLRPKILGKMKKRAE